MKLHPHMFKKSYPVVEVLRLVLTKLEDGLRTIILIRIPPRFYTRWQKEEAKEKRACD
jgi:hypothetical protein